MIERAKERAKRVRPLLIPLGLYLALLWFSVNWLESNPQGAWRYGVALLPMLPGVWMAVGVLRSIQELDELERLILLEGIAVSFMGTLILVLSLGLLQIAGMPPVSGVYIGLFMLVAWLAAKLGLHRKYE